MVSNSGLLKCPKCLKIYIYLKSFNNHLATCKGVLVKSSFKTSSIKTKISIKKKITNISIPQKNWVNIFSFPDEYWLDEVKFGQPYDENIDIGTYHNDLSDFSEKHAKNLKILHLNINSIFLKVDSFHEILDGNYYDILFINETKLRESIPNSHISHNRYSCYRRDRDFTSHCDKSGGGGTLLYIRKEYTHTVKISETFEVMHLTLILKNYRYNFINCYKPPDTDNTDFLNHIDNIVNSIDLNDPIFIVGDLNMDLLSPHGNSLSDFIKNHILKNYISEPTRVCTRFKKNSNLRSASSTLIDVLLHNKDLVSETKVINCPYSDHKFIVGAIKIDSDKPKPDIFWSRNLSEKNLLLIEEKLVKADFSRLDSLKTSDDKWLFLKDKILTVLDTLAPLKKVTLKKENKFPWFDLELYRAKHNRDISYSLAIKSKINADWESYKEARRNFHSLNRSKIIGHFEKCNMKDFKNSKKFWEFYRSSVNIRSDNSQTISPNLIVNDENSITDPLEISSLFNNFFTSIESVSLAKNDECENFIKTLFNKAKKDKTLSTSMNGFSFKPASVPEVIKLVTSLPQSSPGISGISSKVLKLAPSILIPVYTKLFNHCISTNSIPENWKSAIVTPLYKNKGKATELNNYRAISILSPITKIFEKILSIQITEYFDKNKLFTENQHGFRAGHSCETALHELIGDINKSRDKKLTTVLLFIDFKKAFDTVDSNLLLSKLVHYGFDNNSILLLADYFKNRTQVTKIRNHLSNPKTTLLGVPQGSILGPLLFLIFINDLLFFLSDTQAKLFADDTTLYRSGENLQDIMKDFRLILADLLEWCSKNRLDINWTKTFFMVITNKRLAIPESFTFNDIIIKCVKEFKLLGVTIDNKLNFETHVSILGRSINSKLFSIKKIFGLSTDVKVQFFKTFILPYFDYCSTLLIYFNKSVIQRLCNKYYLCLYMLLKLDITDFTDYNQLNDYLLKKYAIPAFHHRLIQRLSVFSFKMLNISSSPENLKEDATNSFFDLGISEMISKEPVIIPDNVRVLRSRQITIKNIDPLSKFIKNTFSYFTYSFLKCFDLKVFNLTLSEFILFIRSNINILFNSFTENFIKFNLELKRVYMKSH